MGPYANGPIWAQPQLGRAGAIWARNVSMCSSPVIDKHPKKVINLISKSAIEEMFVNQYEGAGMHQSSS